MGKKKTRTGFSGSKGIHSSTARSVHAAVKASRPAEDRALALSKSWQKGDNPWLTIPNPMGKAETHKPFVRVRANDYWGKPGAKWSLKSTPAEVTA